MINILQIVRGVCLWAQLYCVSARTLWRWARASVTAWASGTTLKLPSSDWGSWRWWPSQNSSARAPSPPPPSWRAAASPTSSPPATADATGAWRRPSLARRRSNWHITHWAALHRLCVNHGSTPRQNKKVVVTSDLRIWTFFLAILRKFTKIWDIIFNCKFLNCRS